MTNGLLEIKNDTVPENEESQKVRTYKVLSINIFQDEKLQ